MWGCLVSTNLYVIVSIVLQVRANTETSSFVVGDVIWDFRFGRVIGCVDIIMALRYMEFSL